MKLNRKKAVIFDLDGTLVDSMWMWKAIDIEYLAYGLSAVSVAAGRVYEYAVYGFHLLQMADAVCVADGDVI